MSTNQKLCEQIKEEMIKKVMNTKGIDNIERFLLDYLDKLNAVNVVRKYGCSLTDAVDTLDCFRKSDIIKQVLLTLD